MRQLYALGQTRRSRAVTEHRRLLAALRPKRDGNNHISSVLFGNQQIRIADERGVDRSRTIDVEAGRLDAFQCPLTGGQASRQKGVLQGVFVVRKGRLCSRSLVQKLKSLEGDRQEFRVREDERRLTVEQLIKEFWW